MFGFIANNTAVERCLKVDFFFILHVFKNSVSASEENAVSQLQISAG